MRTDVGSPAAGRLRHLGAPVGMLASFAAAWVVVATVDPTRPGHYPVCPLLRLTGLSCPFCGGLRAAHALAHGDVATAARFNLLALALLPVGASLWIGWVARRLRGDAAAALALTPMQVKAILAAAVIFAVVRNVAAGALGP